MKKILSIAVVVVLAMSLMAIATFSGSAAGSQTTIYKFTFESGNATILAKAGSDIGEVVEFPKGSGNHALKYTIGADTRSGAGGVHPYINPMALGGCLAVQGDFPSGGYITFKIDMATDGPTQGSYMYPFMLVNDEGECYMQSECGIYYPGTDSFKTGEWSLDSYAEAGAPPTPGMGNGPIAFCDECTLDEGSNIYIDNVEMIWHGSWKAVTDSQITYRDGMTPAEISEISGGGSTPSSTPVTSRTTAPTTQPQSQTSSIVSNPGGVKGDATGDGKVDMKDVLAIRKSMANLPVSGYNAANADYTGDGKVDMKDVLAIRKFMAGL